MGHETSGDKRKTGRYRAFKVYNQRQKASSPFEHIIAGHRLSFKFIHTPNVLNDKNTDQDR